MEMYEACEAFSSLSQETRLNVFRLLIQFGSDGATPGAIASDLKIPDNTLSFHLSHLGRAGLVSSKKNGRSITYYANTDVMKALVDYLQENCCARQTKRGRRRQC